MITHVRVKNFRSLADVDVTLGPLTVLVGRNGAGKSAFIDVLCFVRDALRLGISAALRKRNGLATLQTWQPNGVVGVMEFGFSIQLEDLRAEYGFSVTPIEQGAFCISREFLRVESKDETDTVFDVENGQANILPALSFYSDKKPADVVVEDAVNGNQFGDPSPVMYFNFNLDPMQLALPVFARGSMQVSRIMQDLTNSYFYGMFPIAQLRRPQSDYHDLALFEDGTNLAALLNHKKTRGVLSVIKAVLRSAVPDIEDIAIDRVGSYLVVYIKHFHSNRADGEPWFDIAQESDGTIHLLTILAALYQTLSPGLAQFSLVAIEEPETALYPAVLSLLGDVVKEASCRSQIIIATQSPDFISEFPVDTLRVVEKRDGATHIGSMDEVQAGILHDQLFTTGDLLRVEGLHSLPAQSVSAEDA